MSSQSKKLGIEQRANVETVVLPVKITLKGHTTQASILSFSDVQEVAVFHESESGAPADATFPTLDVDAAPAVIGVYASVGDAYELTSASVDAGSIVNGGALAMSAGVVTRRGDLSTSRPGVTGTKNISLSISCTGLDIDSAIADCTFILNLIYTKDMRQ